MGIYSISYVYAASGYVFGRMRVKYLSLAMANLGNELPDSFQEDPLPVAQQLKVAQEQASLQSAPTETRTP